jgi:hypothetical protein
LENEFNFQISTKEKIKPTIIKVDLIHNGKIDFEEFKSFLID